MDIAHQEVRFQIVKTEVRNQPIFSKRKLKMRKGGKVDLLKPQNQNCIIEIDEISEDIDRSQISNKQADDQSELKFCIEKLIKTIAGTEKLIKEISKSGVNLFPERNPMAELVREEWLDEEIKGLLNPTAFKRYTLTENPLVTLEMIKEEVKRIESILPEAI